jgi:Icc protein
MLTRRQFLVGAITALAATAGCRANLPLPRLEDEQEQGRLPVRVALLSDTHIQDPSQLSASAVNGKLARAIEDFRPLRPALWICNGDVTDHGLPGEYEAFRKIMGKYTREGDWLVTTGNHEFYDKSASDEVALTRFREAFGLDRPYNSRVVGGIHFVMLADEQWKGAPRNPDWAWLTAEQLRWFEGVLREHREKFTVVCLHQPLQDTVLGTSGGNGFAGCGQVKELKAILQQNPQVKLWLSGHTHRRLEAPGQVVRQGGVVFAALGSTFYQVMPSEAAQGGRPGRSGSRRDLGASQSRLLEIWEDRVVLKARDHVRQVWLDELEVTIERRS